MASKKSRKKKSVRSIESYLSSAKELSNLVPRLKKYRRRKTLSKYEKYSISKAERTLHGVTYLHPVTKQQAKRLKKKLFAPGIRAIRLRGVPPEAKIKIGKKGDLEIKYNEIEWVYWSLDRDTVRSKRGMRKAGTDAFEKQFPIEKISDMATTAFNKMHVQGVSLWTHGGRSDAVFDDLPAFIRWVNEKWSAGRYMRTNQYGELQDSSDPGLWVSGLAIQLEDPEYTKRRKEAQREQNNRNRNKKNT